MNAGQAFPRELPERREVFVAPTRAGGDSAAPSPTSKRKYQAYRAWDRTSDAGGDDFATASPTSSRPLSARLPLLKSPSRLIRLTAGSGSTTFVASVQLAGHAELARLDIGRSWRKSHADKSDGLSYSQSSVVIPWAFSPTDLIRGEGRDPLPPWIRPLAGITKCGENHGKDIEMNPSADGIRIIDFTHDQARPLLSDVAWLGADVIRSRTRRAATGPAAVEQRQS